MRICVWSALLSYTLCGPDAATLHLSPYASEVAYKTPPTSKVLVVALGPMARVRAPGMTVDPVPCCALVPTTERKRLSSVEISEVRSDGEISGVEISEVISDDGLLLRHARGNS